MKISGIKSKLLLAFITVLVIITGLNVGLASYLTTQQSEREAFTSLTRQTVLLQNEVQKTTIELRAIAEKNVAGIDNLSDLSTLYQAHTEISSLPEWRKGISSGSKHRGEPHEQEAGTLTLV